MDHAEIVATYGAAWNEPDAEKRAALLDVSWADDGVYRDPTATAVGREALGQHIGGFQAMAPGHTIELATGVDVHGELFRFAWAMLSGGEQVLEGMDFGEFAADGRIGRIIGFFGPFPPRPA